MRFSTRTLFCLLLSLLFALSACQKSPQTFQCTDTIGNMTIAPTAFLLCAVAGDAKGNDWQSGYFSHEIKVKYHAAVQGWIHISETL